MNFPCSTVCFPLYTTVVKILPFFKYFAFAPYVRLLQHSTMKEKPRVSENSTERSVCVRGYSLLCQRYIMQSKPRSSPHSLFPLGCSASFLFTIQAIIKKWIWAFCKRQPIENKLLYIACALHSQ